MINQFKKITGKQNNKLVRWLKKNEKLFEEIKNF
jgi:hypothetical protein